MSPAEVPDALVDLGYAAMLDAGYRVVEDLGDQVPEDTAVRRVLAAVVPEIQARALNDYADFMVQSGGSEKGLNMSPRMLRRRAARLTAARPDRCDDGCVNPGSGDCPTCQGSTNDRGAGDVSDLTSLFAEHLLAVGNPFGDQREANAAADRMGTALEAVMIVLAEVETTPGLHRITIGQRMRAAISAPLGQTKESDDVSNETDTTGEAARVLLLHPSFKASAEIQSPNAPWWWECDECSRSISPSGHGRETVLSRLAAHQAAMLAEAGLLRPQIAAPVPAERPAAGSAGRGGSGGVKGPQIVVDFTTDTPKFEIWMLRHQVALLKRQIDQANTARAFAQRAASRERERAAAAEAVIERVEVLAESEHAHGDAITRCNLVAQRIRDAIDGPKPETNESEGA